MIKRILVMTVVATAVLSLAAGCDLPDRGAKTSASEKDEMNFPPSHAISRAEEKALIKAAKRNLKIIMESHEDTKTLEKALTGKALADMNEKIAAERAKNTIKIRRYDKQKLSLENYTKGISGLSLTFVDNSYVIDAETEEILRPATGKKLKLIMALKKVKKRWLIFSFFNPEPKSPAPTT